MPRRAIHAVRRRPDERPAAELDPDLDAAPLFDETGELAYIAVTREDPEEGFLGKLRPSATEADLRKKWGGGTYSLSPRNNHGKYLKGVSARELVIAGDPVFASKAAEIRWKRSMGIPIEEPREARSGGGSGNLGIGELILLLNKTSESARQEARDSAEARMREAEAAHVRQLELVREETKRREADLKSERERMHEAAAEREARLVRESSAERDRQREHMQTMMQLVKERSKATEEHGPMSALMAGVKLAMDLRGDGGAPGDPLAALANNLPDVIAEARNLIAMERGGATPRLNPADQEDEEEESDDDGTVRFEGEVGEKARQLVERIRAQGRDPAVVLSRAFDLLARPKETTAAAAAPKTPQPPQEPPPPPAPAPETPAPAVPEAATLVQHMNGARPARAARPAGRRTRKSTGKGKPDTV